MNFIIEQQYLTRIPLLPIDALSLIPQNPSLDEMDGFIRILSKNSILLEGIATASKSLYETIVNYPLAHHDKKSTKSTYFSVLKYYIRAAYRTTPYGLFSGVGIGTLSNCNHISFDSQNKFTRKGRPDMEWINGVISNIQNDATVHNSLIFRVNPNCYSLNNRFINPHPTRTNLNAQDNIQSSSISISKLTKSVISKFSNRDFSFQELLLFIQEAYPQVNQSRIFQYINALIYNEYLISRLIVPFCNTDALSHILYNLNCMEVSSIPLAHELSQLKSDLESLNALPLGSGINAYMSCTKRMKHIFPDSKNELQHDLCLNLSNNTLAYSDVSCFSKNLEKLINAARGYTKNPALENFVNKFLDRFGYCKEVSLVELFAPSVGLYPLDVNSPPSFYSHEHTPDRYQKLCKLLNDKLIGFVGGSIELTSEDLLSLSTDEKNSGPELPISFDVACYILRDSSLKDAIKFMLSPIAGTQEAHKVVGRFEYLLENDILKEFYTFHHQIEQNLNAFDTSLIEYHEAPSSKRLANLCQNKSFCKHQVALSTNTPQGVDEIPLSDLTVGIDQTTNNVYVYSKSLSQRVTFSFPNMLNPMLQSTFARFLMGTSSTGAIDFSCLIGDIGSYPITHMPRIIFENIIISPERWTIDVTHCLTNLETFSIFVNRQRLLYSIP